MRILCVILLACLVIIGSVSALSVNPAAIPAVKTLASTPQPTVVPVLAKPVTAVAVADVWVTLEINSLPSGATVTVDGQSTMQGATPYKVALHPGSHTILLTLDGYKDFTTTVNLQAGNPVAFDAQLQKVITAAAVRENIAAVNTVVAQHVTLRTIAPAGDNTIACLSGQECLTLAEAGERFAPGWYYTEGSVCGYNGSVAEILYQWITQNGGSAGSCPGSGRNTIREQGDRGQCQILHYRKSKSVPISNSPDSRGAATGRNHRFDPRLLRRVIRSEGHLSPRCQGHGSLRGRVC